MSVVTVDLVEQKTGNAYGEYDFPAGCLPRVGDELEMTEGAGVDAKVVSFRWVHIPPNKREEGQPEMKAVAYIKFIH